MESFEFWVGAWFGEATAKEATVARTTRVVSVLFMIFVSCFFEIVAHNDL